MSEATDFRSDITEAVTEFGSTIIITPRTQAEGSYGGYEPGVDTDSTAVTTKGLPSANLISKEGQPFGKLKAGEIVLVVTYDETIAINDQLSYRGADYVVGETKDVYMQDTVIGKRIKLVRKLD